MFAKRRSPALARVAVASLNSFRRPRHAPRRVGASAVRAGSRRGRRTRLYVRSARRSVRRHRPVFHFAWRHRCRIIGLGQLAACLAPRLYGSLAPSRSCVPRDPDASTIDRARSAMRRRLRVTLALYTPWAKQSGAFMLGTTDLEDQLRSPRFQQSPAAPQRSEIGGRPVPWRRTPVPSAA